MVQLGLGWVCSVGGSFVVGYGERREKINGDRAWRSPLVAD